MLIEEKILSFSKAASACFTENWLREIGWSADKCKASEKKISGSV